MLEESELKKYSRSSVGNGGLLETIEDLQVTYRLYNPFGFLMLFDTSNYGIRLPGPSSCQIGVKGKVISILEW